MTQTNWERGRRYAVADRTFLYHCDALKYARHIFKATGAVVAIESIYLVKE